jgi:hypothetical protein
MRGILNHLIVVSVSLLLFFSFSAFADPVTIGLVSSWSGNGNSNDAVGTNNGNIVGNVTYSPGVVGDAFIFNGGYVQVPNSSSLNITGSLTIDAWIFPTIDGFEHIAAKWGDTGDWNNQRAFSFHMLPNGELRFAISDDANQWNIGFHDFDTSAGVITINSWNFVTATYDQSTGTRKIYVNGVMVAERTDDPITLTSSNADLGIGAQLTSSTSYAAPFTGSIDEVHIFNRALTDVEIQQEFNNVAPVPEPSTLLLLGSGIIGLIGISRKKGKSLNND